MDIALGLILGIINSLLMTLCFVIGVNLQRKWSQAEVFKQARQMVDDMMFNANSLSRSER